MFKAVLKFADGEVVDDNATFVTEEEAEEHGYQMLSDYGTGVTVLSMRNLENSPEADEVRSWSTDSSTCSRTPSGTAATARRGSRFRGARAGRRLTRSY